MRECFNFDRYLLSPMTPKLNLLDFLQMQSDRIQLQKAARLIF
jgi:hypothetical protein